MINWIKVKDKLPILEDNSVLVYYENGYMAVVRTEDWFSPDTKWYLVAHPIITHWMPLPPRPTN